MGPVVIDKLRENEFDVLKTMRKLLHLRKEKIESVSISKKAEYAVYNEIIMEDQQSVYQDLGCSLRKMRTEAHDNNLILQKHKSTFETYEIPPGVNEVGDNSNILLNLI